MIAVLLFGQVQEAFATDQSHNHTFQNDTLAQLIEVRDDDNEYDVEETQAMIERVAAIPENMLQKLVAANLSLIFMDYPLTQLPEYEHLVGEVPRGWEDTGLTWDDVPGVGGSNTAARIGYSEFGSGHGAINLELHEISHSIDNYLDTKSNRVSETEEFLAIHTAEKEMMFPGNTYFDYVEEYFAEVMAYYYLSSDSKAILQQNAPQTYEFIDTLSLRVLLVDRTEDTVDLSWEAVPSAESYEIYRVGDEEGPIAATAETSYQDTNGIEKLSHYIYYVVALDGAGNKINRTYETWAYSMAPDPPVNFEVTVNDDNTVTLSWDEVEDAVEYILTRDGEEIGRTTSVTYTDDTELDPGTYGYGIRLINDLGEESGSLLTYITIGEEEEPDEPIVEQPEAPENVVATLGDYHSVTLTWDEVDTADFYRIYRDNEEIGTTTSLAYTESGLDAETEYAYYVEAVNEAGSAAADVVNITTGIAPEVPETPQNVEANLAEYNAVTLSWSAVEAADSYTIFRNGEVIDTTTETLYTDRALNEETEYMYTIQAVNDVGSSEGATVQITTGTSPEEPEDIEAELEDYHTVVLSWMGAEHAEEYIVLRNGEEIATTTALTYTDSELDENTTYMYTIQFLNEDKIIEDLASVEITTGISSEEPGPELPDTPQNVKATLTDYQTVTLSWDTVENADAYTISRDGEVITTTTETSYIDSGLNEATLYTYTIQAVNDVGSSERVSTDITTGTAPDEPEEPGLELPKQPENLKAGLASYNSVSLAWDSVENADAYTIFRDGEEIDTIIESTYTDSNLSENTTYTYTIQAVNDAGVSKGAVIEITTSTAPEEGQEPEDSRESEVSEDTSEREKTESGDSEEDPGVEVIIEDEESKEKHVASSSDENKTLPATATNNHTILLVGATLMIIGLWLLFIYRRKKRFIE